MIPTKLEELIKKGETLYTEFKSAKVHPDALASTIVSFLNTNGGVLLLGVEDDKTITGIDDIDATIQRVEQILSNNITPRATAYIEAIEYMDSTLLKIDIKQGIDRPYHTIRGQCFIRVNAGKRLASREEIRRMYLTVTISTVEEWFLLLDEYA